VDPPRKKGIFCETSREEREIGGEVTIRNDLHFAKIHAFFRRKETIKVAFVSSKGETQEEEAAGRNVPSGAPTRFFCGRKGIRIPRKISGGIDGSQKEGHRVLRGFPWKKIPFETGFSREPLEERDSVERRKKGRENSKDQTKKSAKDSRRAKILR